MRIKFFKSMRGFVTDTGGAAIIEFALVLPFLLLVFFGVIIWGFTLTMTDNMYDAARQAARELAVGTSNEIQAKATAQQNLAAWGQIFTITAQDTSSTGTNYVQVTISINNQLASLMSVMPTVSSLSAQVTMRKE